MMLQLRQHAILESFLTTNFKPRMKGDQAYTCNHELRSFQVPISSCALHYVDIVA